MSNRSEYHKAMTQEQIQPLIEAYDKYIQLMSDELNGLSGLALAHGWKSKRYEEGKLCREEISLLKMQILSLPNADNGGAEEILEPYLLYRDSVGNSFDLYWLSKMNAIKAMQSHAQNEVAKAVKERDIDIAVLKGALGYPVKEDTSFILTDGTPVLNGIANALEAQLTAANTEIERLKNVIRKLHTDLSFFESDY